MEKTYGLEIEGPYEGATETNANDWRKEVRRYYKIPPVKVLGGVVVTGSKAGN